MEKTKLILDVGITVFGLLAAVFAILSLVYSSKIDYVKKIEEERLKGKIAESNASAEKAKEEAANALSSAANTNERAKKLELQVEDQKERAANAEKELIILKDKIKSRTIPVEKVNELINGLKKIPKIKIHISSSLGDGEAASYADHFLMIFKSAGWEVDSGIGRSTFTGVGVYIITKNPNDSIAGKMQILFESSGITLQGQITENMGLQIFVGSKAVSK